MSALEREVDGPYVGLEPFQAAHGDYFFGRTLDAAVLADNVLARKTVVLYGASGVGKSSMLNVAFPKALKEQGANARIATQREWHEPSKLMAWLDSVSKEGRLEQRLPLILVLDQFEEYFLYPTSKETDQFFGALAALLASRTQEVHLLFSLRDDALHRLDLVRRYLPGLLDTTIELRHLDDDAVREAVICPVSVWNRHPKRATEPPVELDPDFADTLISQLRPKDADGVAIAGGRVELAYLQLTLQRIWEAEGGINAKWLHTRTLTKDLKGVSEISRRHVDKVLNGLDEAGQEVCAVVFDRLVTPSGGKILYKVTDLAEIAGIDWKVLDKVLASLAHGRSRLLHAIDLPGAENTRGYEILHDILASPILKWREGRDAQAARKRANKAAKMSRLLAALALLSMGLGINAFRDQRLASSSLLEATRVRLTAKAETELSKTANGADTAALRFMLAAHALSSPAAVEDAHKTAETLEGVGKALFRVPSFLHSYEVDGLPKAIAVSLDRKRLAVATEQGDLYFWRRDSEFVGQQIKQATAPVSALAMSRSGTHVASGRVDGQIYVCDFDALDGCEQLNHPSAAPGEVIALALAPDGTFVVAAVGSAGGYLWPANSEVGKGHGAPIPMRLPEQASSIAVMGDGRTVVMAAGTRLYSWNAEDVMRKALKGLQVRANVLQVFNDTVRSIAPLTKEGLVAVGLQSGELAIVSLDKDVPVRFRRPDEREPLSPILVVKDLNHLGDQSVVTGDERGRVGIWAISTNSGVESPRWLNQNATGSIVDLAAIAEEGRVIVAGEDKVIREWAIGARGLGAPISERSIQNAQLVSDPRWTSDGPVALYLAGGKVGIGGLAANMVGQEFVGDSSGDVLSLSLSPNVSLAAAGTRESGFTVWKIRERTARTISAGSAEVMAFSTDEQFLATSGAGGVIRLWTVRDASISKPIEMPTGEDLVTALVFANDGRLFAGTFSGAILSINPKVKSIRPLNSPEVGFGSVTALAFAEGAGRLISAHSLSRQGRRQGVLHIWDTNVETADASIGSVLIAKPAQRLATMSNGVFLAATSTEGDVSVWQLAPDAGVRSAFLSLYSFEADDTSNVNMELHPPASLSYLEQDGAIWVVNSRPEKPAIARRLSAPDMWPSRLCAQLRTRAISDLEWAPYQSAISKPPSLCY